MKIKSKVNKMFIGLIVCCVTVLLTLISPIHHSTVHAQASLESDNYRIQMPNFNSGAGIPSSNSYKLGSTIGQTAPGLYTSTGYLIRSGFQYIHSIIPFSFSISNYLINFGTIIPQTPSTITSTLTVSAGGAGGYSVTAREEDALKSSNGVSIPDTACDSGTCTNSTAGVWTSNSVYGFGYNMTGDDIPADFVNSTYYRRFANKALSETDKVVMSSALVGRSRISTITYKINISSIQAAGNYQNKILFTALPSF